MADFGRNGRSCLDLASDYHVPTTHSDHGYDSRAERLIAELVGGRRLEREQFGDARRSFNVGHQSAIVVGLVGIARRKDLDRMFIMDFDQ